jgi:hypothetical protein
MKTPSELLFISELLLNVPLNLCSMQYMQRGFRKYLFYLFDSCRGNANSE